MDTSYEDFELIVDGTEGGYTVAARGPAEIRVHPVEFVYHESEALQIELNRIRLGFMPSRERMQDVGALLFRALFPYEIIPALNSARNNVPEGAYLRLKLTIRPAELSRLPWELLYNVLEGHFIGPRRSLPIVRYIEQGRPAAQLLSRRPVRILYVQANPPGTTQLDSGANEGALREALGAEGQVEALTSATPAALRDVLREQAFHVLHYDGHGAFDEATDTGHLFLHSSDGETHRLSAEMLASYVDGTAVRLVVLSACETAMESAEKRFSGMAQQLMRTTRLPASVAMQYEIPDASARAFSREFYKALADDDPVEAAVVEGRKAILELLGEGEFASPDWATPVLYLRAQDGRLLREDVTVQLATEAETQPDARPAAPQHGGVSISGSNISVGGSVVGGDQVIYGDQVRGDKIDAGDISGTGVAVGAGAQATVQPGHAGEGGLSRMFQDVYRLLENRHEDVDVDKEEIAAKVRRIEAEAAKGEFANESKLARWLADLGDMAPDILEFVVKRMADPSTGAAEAVRHAALAQTPAREN